MIGKVSHRFMYKRFQIKWNFEKYVQWNTDCRTKNDFQQLQNVNELVLRLDNQFYYKFAGFVDFMESMYPHFQWTIFDLDRASRNYWNSKVRFFLEEFSSKNQMKFERIDDWKHLDVHSLLENKGATLIKKTPVFRILEQNFPEFFWDKVWRFPHLECLEKKRIYMDKLLQSYFGFVEMKDQLGEITAPSLAACPDGSTIVTFYQGSVKEVFHSVYPELIPRYRNVGRSYWKELGARNHLLAKAMRCFNVRQKEDWYQLSVHQFSEVFGKQVHKSYFIRLLKTSHPEEEWCDERLSDRVNKRSRQKYLGMMITKLFKDEVILEDYLFKDSDHVFVFDFFLPGLQLVIEYQGEQHYYSVLRWVTLEGQNKKDKEKRLVCLQNGFDILLVPYWWDGSLHQLQNLFHPLQKHQFNS